jgi:hypothetical protein
MDTRPEEPELVVPERNVINPLTPAVPAFGVRTTSDPEVLGVDVPVVMLTKPPVCPVLPPLDATRSPPVLPVAMPTLSSMFPDLPVVAVPVDRTIFPEEPELVVPVLKTIAPLIPVVPAFTVFITTEPLDVVVPAPVDNEMKPPVVPVAVDVSPAVT